MTIEIAIAISAVVVALVFGFLMFLLAFAEFVRKLS